ncbi:MAG: ribose 5-phosphate isomerase B [candidate division WOR-3 bacterium]
MKLGIGADHRGFELKSAIKEFLEKKGNKVVDFGTNNTEPVDYPSIALQVAKAVKNRRIKYGIVSCFSGQGMAIAANKVRGVRAAICTDKELAYYARAHNDANILVLPAMTIKSKKQWRPIIETFLRTKFEGGRHRRRLKIIKDYEDSAGCV